MTRAELMLRKRTLFSAQTYAYAMSTKCSLGIDDKLELAKADMALRKRAGEQLRVSVQAAQAST